MRQCLSCALSALLVPALAIMGLRYLTDFWLLSLVYSFQLHLGIACTIGAMLCVALRRNIVTVTVLAAAILLAGHSYLMNREFVRQAAAAPSSAKALQLISFNILNSNRSNGVAIADFLASSNADVVFIFEAIPISNHLAKLASVFPYHAGCGPDLPSCELAVFSKYPIRSKEVISLSEIRANHLAMVETEINGRPVHFAAAHLTKPYFDNIHSYELRQLADRLHGITGPLILGGDFNSASIAPDMQRFLRQTGLSKVGPEPATWPIAAGPFGIAIDHVFINDDVVPLELKRLPENFGSNHYGLIADLAIATP